MEILTQVFHLENASHREFKALLEQKVDNVLKFVGIVGYLIGYRNRFVASAFIH